MSEENCINIFETVELFTKRILTGIVENTDDTATGSEGVVTSFEIKGRGNSQGNLANNGEMVENGDWVYFSYNGYGNKDRWNGLYKMRADGSDKQLAFSSGGKFLNSVGEYIIFCNAEEANCLYKLNAADGQVSKLYDAQASNVYSEDGLIYYINNSEHRIYCVNLEGSSVARIGTQDGVIAMTVCDGWIFYAVDGCSLFKMRTNGSAVQNIYTTEDLNLISSLQCYGGNIYFIDKTPSGDSPIKCLDIHGGPAVTVSQGNYRTILVDSDEIYYSASLAEEPYAEFGNMNLDGAQKRVLADKRFNAIALVDFEGFHCLKGQGCIRIPT